MSEIKNVGKTWMAKCDQLTHLSFKGLKASKLFSKRSQLIRLVSVYLVIIVYTH